jgi:hypothetical protein
MQPGRLHGYFGYIVSTQQTHGTTPGAWNRAAVMVCTHFAAAPGGGNGIYGITPQDKPFLDRGAPLGAARGRGRPAADLHLHDGSEHPPREGADHSPARGKRGRPHPVVRGGHPHRHDGDAARRLPAPAPVERDLAAARHRLPGRHRHRRHGAGPQRSGPRRVDVRAGRGPGGGVPLQNPAVPRSRRVQRGDGARSARLRGSCAGRWDAGRRRASNRRPISRGSFSWGWT